MKTQLKIVFNITALTLLLFGFNSHGQELFSTIFNEEANWDNPGGTWGGYNEKTYEKGDWFFHSTSAVRGTPAFDETFGGSAYSFRDRDVFSFYNTAHVSGMSGFSLQLRDWMTGSGVDRNLKLSTDGGENWETVAVINKAWFDAYQVYQEFIYYFPEGVQSFAAEEFMIELDGGTNDNVGRINIGQFVALGESTTVITPVFNPNGGTFFNPVDVEIQTATPDAIIYYSMDSETGPWTIFEEEITVSETTTIWAYATADGLDDSNVAHATFTFPEVTEVATLAELREMPVDDSYYRYTGDAVIVAMDDFRNRKFIQDETAAILIDDFPGVITTEYDLYDVITGVLGKLNLFNNMLRFQPQANTEPATQNIPTEPYIFALDEVTADDQAKLIHFSNVSFVDVDDGQVFTNGTNYVITDGMNEFVLRTDFWDVDYIGEPIPHHSLDITGVMLQFLDDFQIVPRFAADIEQAALSNNANLETFTVGGIDVLDLAGLVVDDPQTDAGAILYVEDLEGFQGIVLETEQPMAVLSVTIHGETVAEEELEDLPIAEGDVILVTVTAENQVTEKHYKLTVTAENRVLTILTPITGDEFITGQEIHFSWEAENISQLIFEIFLQGVEEPTISQQVPAAQQEIYMDVPNGMHGSHKYRLTDSNDPSFYSESDYFSVIDIVDPELLDKDPETGSENILVTAGLTMTFDEDVMAGAGSIHIYKEQGNQLIESIAADSDQVIFAEDEVLVSLTADLEFETSYYILIDDTAIKDIAGNHFEGIDNPESWTFTTGEDALICNGDFEIWIDGLPECWFGEKSNISAANVVQYADDPYTGNYAAQLINAGSTHQRFTSQATSVEESMSYEITFWVKGSGEIRTGLFDDRETGFGFAPYNDYIIVESDTWAEHSQIVTAVNTSDIAEFIFSLRNTNEALGHLQLDHVRVEEYMDPPTEVDNLAELRNMPDDGTVYHYTGNAVIVAMDDFRNRKFIQDETAAILIDDPPGIITATYDLYDVISDITGKISILNNMVRFQPEQNTQPATENTPVDPVIFAFDEVKPDDQAKLIQFVDVVFVDIEEGDVFENNNSYTISDGIKQFILRTDFFGVDYIGEVIPSIALDITGVIRQDDDELQLIPRFNNDIQPAALSNNATLSKLEVAGFNVLDLEGLIVADPAAETGATLFIEDFTDARGIVVETQHHMAQFSVTVNDDEISEQDLEDLPLAAGNVILVTVTAENSETVKYYKLSLTDDNRMLTILAPTVGAEFFTYAEILFSWESENIVELLFELYSQDEDDPLLSEVVPADQEEIAKTVPNGMHGSYFFRLKDNEDHDFFKESGVFTVVDNVNPGLVEKHPEAGAINVPLDTYLKLIFDEEVIAGEGSIKIFNTEDDVLIEDIVVDSEFVTFDREEVYVNLSASLDIETTYYILINGNAFKDIAGNAFEGIDDPTFWTFTTRIDETPAEVDNLADLRSMPADGTAYHFTGQAVIVAMDDHRNRKFIQDETAAILIDDQPGVITTVYQLYDVITGITGKIHVENNMVRFQPHENTPPATDNTPVEPLTLALDEVTADDQAKLVLFENVVFLDTGEDAVFEHGTEYTITDGVSEFILKTDFAGTDYIEELIPLYNVNITGVILQYQDDLQIVPRLLDDIQTVLSSNASLAEFLIAGRNVLNLGGIIVDDPDTDQGAVLYLTDFTDLQGISIETENPNANYEVMINNLPIDHDELDEQPIVPDDEILVSVTAEDMINVKYYKVTVTDDIRVLTILKPLPDDEFFTYDDMVFSWEAENLNLLKFELFMQDVEEPMITLNLEAAQQEYTMEVPNGMHGYFKFRLTDTNDPSYFDESDYFIVSDNAAPQLIAGEPAQGSVNVETDTALTLVFDEPVFPHTGSLNIYKQHESEPIITLEADSEYFSYNNDTVSVQLPHELDYVTTYSIVIDNNAFVDIAGNGFDGIHDPNEWTFTTRIGDDPGNLVCNGNFDYWTNGLPYCWYGERSNIAMSDVNQYAENPYFGNLAVQLINTGTIHKRFSSEHVSVENGLTYEITFWVKGKGEIRTGLFDNRETGLGYAIYNEYIVIQNDSWSEHSQIITAVNTTDIAEFIFSVRNTDPDLNHLQLDHVRVEVYEEPPVEVDKLALLRTLPDDGTLYNYTGNAVIVAIDDYRNRKFIQDETAAILIDDPSGIITGTYELYDVITGITGEISISNNMVRFQPVADIEQALENTVVEPEIVALEEVTADDQAKLLQFEGVSFVNSTENAVFENGVEYTITDGVNFFILKTDFTDVDYIGEEIPDRSLHITGVLLQHDDDLQIVPRFLADIVPADYSNNANLATFVVGGFDVVDLSGIIVDDPAAEYGAVLFIDDFTDVRGIIVETDHYLAGYSVSVNGNDVDEHDMEDYPLEAGDVILVTVTAEDQLTEKHYKLNLTDENRILTILTPPAGAEFFTYDEILFSWESENIEELLFELFSEDEDDPLLSEVLPASQEEITKTIPNGMQGSYLYRLTDNEDHDFFVDSGVFTIVDNVYPVLVEKYPATGATNVSIETDINLVFDEVVNAGEGSIHIFKTEGDVLTESVLADSDAVTFDREEVYLNLAASLEFSTSYYILIDDNAIKDNWGNYFEGIDDPSYWTFITHEHTIICNGDFEFWADGVPVCWYGEKSNIAKSNVNQYAENPYTGNYAVQLINTASSHQRFTSQPTSVEEAILYEIIFWVKGKGEIRTGLFDDRETGFGYAPYNEYIFVESDSWVEYSQIVTAVNTSDIAEIIFSLRNTNAASGHLQLDNVRVKELDEEPPTEVDNLADLRSLPDDGTVYKYTGNAVIVAMDDFRNRKFIQDETAAILIDDQPGIITTDYQLYDVITGITGKINISNNMVRFQPQENTEPASENSPVEPYTFALNEITSDDQAKLIQFENVMFIGFDVGDVFENGQNYSITDGVNEFVVRTDFWDVDYIGEEIPTGPFNIAGVILQFNDDLQIVPRFMDDFEMLDVPYFTVTFTVTDAYEQYIEHAVVTLGDIENAEGEYVFEGIPQGLYEFTVSALCYFGTSGQIYVDDNMIVEVALDLNVMAGDANGDGIVNILDAIAVANFIIDNNNATWEFCYHNADVNNDDEINILDLIEIVLIFADDTGYPDPNLDSDTAHIFLQNDGVTLDSDGTLAGLQIEILTNGQELVPELLLADHEMIYSYIDGVLRIVIFSHDHSPIPEGFIDIVDFGIEIEAEWSEVMAGNLNAEEVPVETHDDITDISNISETAWKVYPNPVSETLWIEFNNRGQSLLYIMNIKGQTVITIEVLDQGKQLINIDAGGLTTGLYMIKFKSQEDAFVKKIFVK